MANIETLAQDIKTVKIDGADVPRDCLGIIDHAAELFAYHIVDTSIVRHSDYAPYGHTWGHLARFFEADARTRCGITIHNGTGGELNLFHTTKLCKDCAKTVPGLRLTRQFKITKGTDQFSIREVEPTNLVSLDYRDKTVSREGAWQAASIQPQPVIFYGLDGDIRYLGVVFNPERFERAAYEGYVSAGYMMSDGYYAPIAFEHWVTSFRKSPTLDEPEQRRLRDALPTYVASLPLRAD